MATTFIGKLDTNASEGVGLFFQYQMYQLFKRFSFLINKINRRINTNHLAA